MIGADIVIRLRNLLTAARLPLNFSASTLHQLCDALSVSNLNDVINVGNVGNVRNADCERAVGGKDAEVEVRRTARPLSSSPTTTTTTYNTTTITTTTTTTTTNTFNTTQSTQTLSAERFLQLMSRDKKVNRGRLNLVLLRGSLGGAVVTNEFDVEAVRRVVCRYCNRQ